MNSQIGRTLQQIGFANLLWNKIEVLWYLYFTVLLKGTSRAQTDAIYRSLDTGNKKRGLILSVSAETLQDNSPDLAKVRDAMRRTNEAATARNSLIHADFHLTMDNGTTNIGISRGGDHSKPNRLASLELDAALSNFIRTLKSLVEEVESLLPSEPAMPPGVPFVPLTSVRFVQWLEDLIATEGGEPLDRPNSSPKLAADEA